MRRTLVGKTQEPEFNSQHPSGGRRGQVWLHTLVIPELGRRRQADPWSLLASQCSQTSEYQKLKEKIMIEKDIPRHVLASTYAGTLTQTHTSTQPPLIDSTQEPQYFPVRPPVHPGNHFGESGIARNCRPPNAQLHADYTRT